MLNMIIKSLIKKTDDLPISKGSKPKKENMIIWVKLDS